MASAASGAQRAVVHVLMDEGVLDTVSNQLANTWVRTGDYLLAASSFPPSNVVSNHLYVRLEEMKPSTALLCRKLYPTMIGRADLYIAFLRRPCGHLPPAMSALLSVMTGGCGISMGPSYDDWSPNTLPSRRYQRCTGPMHSRMRWTPILRSPSFGTQDKTRLS